MDDRQRASRAGMVAVMKGDWNDGFNKGLALGLSAGWIVGVFSAGLLARWLFF